VLLVYVLPTGFFVVLPTDIVLLIALAMVLSLEVLRHKAGLQMPTLRPHEAKRIASFAFFAVGLTLAVLLFPQVVAIVVVLGAVLIDPLMGELRLLKLRPLSVRAAGVAGYLAIALPCFLVLGGWSGFDAVGAGIGAAVVATQFEGPQSPIPLDDDLAMVLVPGLLLTTVLWATTGSFRIPAF
jgi:dolichol kinase